MYNMESHSTYRTELLEEISNEFDYMTFLEDEIEQLRAQVTELRGGVCSKTHGAEQTFDCSEYACPDCGMVGYLFGYQFYDQSRKHQHTHYVCTYWASNHPDATLMDGSPGRCGWHGWKIPAPTRSNT